MFRRYRNFVLLNSDNGAGGSGGSLPAGPGTTITSGTAQTPAGDGNGTGEPTRTFKQSELDTLFTERAKRASESAISELLKTLGVTDVETLKTTLGEADKARRAQMSELEKAQAEAADWKTKAEQAQAAQAEALTKATERLMQAAVQAEAAKQNFLPEAVGDVWGAIDRAKVKAKDDGGQSGALAFDGIEEAVKAVAKAKPHWVKPAGSGALGTPLPRQPRQPAGNQQQAPRKAPTLERFPFWGGRRRREMADVTLTAAKVAAVFPEKAEIVTGIAGVTITAGQAVYIIAASGKLGLADENASAEASHVFGIALNGGAAGQAIDVLRRGHVYGFDISALDYWSPCSLSNTAGALDSGATTNIVARVAPLTDASLTKVLYVDCTLAAAS